MCEFRMICEIFTFILFVSVPRKVSEIMFNLLTRCMFMCVYVFLFFLNLWFCMIYFGYLFCCAHHTVPVHVHQLQFTNWQFSAKSISIYLHTKSKLCPLFIRFTVKSSSNSKRLCVYECYWNYSYKCTSHTT